MGLRRLRDFFARLRDHLTDHASGRNERVLGLSALTVVVLPGGKPPATASATPVPR